MREEANFICKSLCATADTPPAILVHVLLSPYESAPEAAEHAARHVLVGIELESKH